MTLAEDRRVAGGDYDRTPPQAIEAEQSVLGAMLLSKDAIADVVEVLRPGDFYRPAHQLVYDAILDLYSRGEPADAITVSAELTRAGQLARVGGAPYLHTLVAGVPTAANAGYYASIVAERAVLRRLVTAGTRIVQMGYETASGSCDVVGSVDEVVDRAQAEIYEVTERRTSEDYVHIESLLQPTLDEIDKISATGGVGTGIPTGFQELDEYTNGLHAGQMITIAGRPGTGKALALDTPLPTPTGWTTMGAVRVGDLLLGADGRPTRVVAATDVMGGRPCYEVRFSDGSRIVADAQHQWLTTTPASRPGSAGPPRAPERSREPSSVSASAPTRSPATRLSAVGRQAPAVRRQAGAVGLCAGERQLWAHQGGGEPSTEAALAGAIARIAAASGRRALRAPVRCTAVVTTEALAAALRRGGGSCAVDCAAPLQLPHAELPVAPHTLGVWLAGGAGLKGDHRIPARYLRASEPQRRALLAGLLRTGGRGTRAGTVELTIGNGRLAQQVYELVVSLGHRATLRPASAPDRAVGSSTGYTVAFTPGAERSRSITSVRATASVPVRCVQVDNDASLYLAGQSMIPTHNSTLALDIARSAAVKNTKPTVIFSLEMSKVEIMMRLFSAEASVALQNMRSGHMSDQDWTRLARRSSELADAPLFIDDSPNLTMMEIRAKARRLRQRHDLQLVVIDYLQLMTSGKRVESRQQEVSEFSRAMKLLAKELEVPVVALSQLNRGPEQRTDKKPLLSDLRESGSIEQDSDVVLLVHRPDLYEPETERAGEADLILAKHRNGPTATVAVAFQGRYSRFADMPS